VKELEATTYTTSSERAGCVGGGSEKDVFSSADHHHLFIFQVDINNLNYSELQ